MVHDYQSLVFLTWILLSLAQSNNRLFVKLTTYLWLPMMILCYVWYYVTNIFGLINYDGDSENEMHKNENNGFYQFHIPVFIFSFMQLNLLIVALWTRLTYIEAEKTKKLRSTMPSVFNKKYDFHKNTLRKIMYLIIANVHYVLFLGLIFAGIS